MKKIFFFLLILVFFSAGSSQSWARRSRSVTPRAKTKITPASEQINQKRSAEVKHKKINAQIKTLKKEIVHTEHVKGQVSEDLTKAQREIESTQNTLQTLENRQLRTEQKLSELSTQQRALSDTVAKQQRQLARIIRQQYISGNENRLKMLFSGENPNRIARDMRYMGYFSSAYAKLIASFRQNVQAIKAKRIQTATTRQQLDEIVSETSIQKAQLEKKKSEHAALLEKLSNKLDTQKKKAEQLEQSERQLSSLINQLAQNIEATARAEQQRRDQQLAAERLRIQRMRQARTQARKQQASATRSKIESVSPSKIEPDPIAAERNIQAPIQPQKTFQSSGRGTLPINGSITAHFGTRRSDGPSWKGIFISAPQGGSVHASASGKVVYAGFLRGYGNLLIIDHGNHYMTIYANVQSINKSAGSIVSERETIATVGNSSENMQTGLYFEVRRAGHAINPLEWVR